MRKAGRANLDAIRLVGAVRYHIYTELTLGGFHGGVHLAFWQTIALGEQLEVVNQSFHVSLHLFAPWWSNLVVIHHDGARVATQPLDALAYDAVALAHLFDTNQV